MTLPSKCYLDENNIYEPDVLCVVPDSQCEIGEKRLVGAPDLVVEVLSPGTAKHDRQQKYEAYQRHGVREYWIVDPAYDVVEGWVLAEGAFRHQGVYADSDQFSSTILGETVSIPQIFG